MATVRVVTDSTSDLPASLRQELGIEMVPLNVHFGNEAYRDQIDLGPAEFFAQVAASPVHPRTSQPAPGDFLQVYQRLTDEGHDVLSIHLSGNLSGTFQSATMAKEILPPGSKIELVDTLSASGGLGLVVLGAARLANQGATLEECAAYAREASRRSHIVLAVETLDYLQRNGRIGRASAMLGGVLGIRPILQVQDGWVAPLDKVRGRGKVLPRILEAMQERVPAGRRIRLAVVHAQAPEQASEWLEAIRPVYQIDELLTLDLGAVIATHVGPGTVGVCFHESL